MEKNYNKECKNAQKEKLTYNDSLLNIVYIREYDKTNNSFNIKLLKVNFQIGFIDDNDIINYLKQVIKKSIKKQ